jgi:thioredoxin-dependent peroxiredoxin
MVSVFAYCRGLAFCLGLVSMSVSMAFCEEPAIPVVGDRAPDFTLKSIDDASVELSQMLDEGPVVVVVLRGYPGYQCPLCTRQVASLIEAKKGFAEKRAKVVLVYPGAVSDLTAKANEFLAKTKLPEGFVLVTDPEYKFTDAYGLRWEAPQETAYPSTFVIDSTGKVMFSVVSRSHGGRAETKKILASIP